MHTAECVTELVEEASRDELTPVNFLELVLERELERKNERRIQTTLRKTGCIWTTVVLQHPPTRRRFHGPA
jgi:hypothetical protein